MIIRSAHLGGGCAPRSDEGGYVAVMTALLLMVFMGFAAFAVDVGHWYLVGQQEQRAADAAAMAGVTFLPGNLASANTTAQNYSKVNGFANGVNATTVTSELGGQPTRLQVTVTQTVSNFFGSLLGVPSTAVTRTAIADYAGPVPLGSPCNEFGADPLPAGHESANCAFAGQFWANVGSPQGTKVSGDAYQDGVCNSSPLPDGCSGSTAGPNIDYAPNGYFYTVTVSRPVTNLQIQVFDPAMIVVGDTCTNTTGASGNNLTLAAALPAAHTLVSDPSVRYVAGTGPYCTGDMNLNSTTGLVNTQFTVHAPGVNAWDPNSWPLQANCDAVQPNPRTFLPYNGDMSKALDTTNAAYTARPDVAANFRQWVNLCTVGTVPAGTYAVQVKTNDVGANSAGGHNRFSVRAFGSGSGDNDVISVAGFNYMAMYANTPSGTTTDYLAKIPSGAKGQTFNVRLFDVGDGAVSGSTIKILPPAETSPTTFSGCTGLGPTIGTGALTDCQINVDNSYNGKWETISIPISSTYSCNDASTTGCWVRLQFYYGPSSTPNDTFSVTANINGDPVRIVQ